MPSYLSSLLFALLLVVAAATREATPQQRLPAHNVAHNDPEVHLMPGDSGFTYGPVPRREQIFDIEAVQVSPMPLELDKFTFLIIRGSVSPLHRHRNMMSATLNVTTWVDVPGRGPGIAATTTVPLRSVVTGSPLYHLAIREARGRAVDMVHPDGVAYDVVADFCLVSAFLEEGMHGFEVSARLDDGTWLFAGRYEQWLDGRA